MSRVVVWFSCGAASAYAAKLAVEKYGDRCVVAYCASTLSTEHPDNMRFLRDVEQWIGKPITLLYSEKYEDIFDVYQKTRYLVGVDGARCTTELKKVVRRRFQEDGDIHVFGLTADEQVRIDRFAIGEPDLTCDWILRDAGVTKSLCYRAVREASIVMPTMYLLGYKNNNCIGCVKGQSGYWNKVRVDFPDQFARMALIEREMNVAINKRYEGKKRIRVFLDELPPDAGRYDAEVDIECGVVCVTANQEEPMSKLKLHAMLSPSGAEGWMTCTGKPAMEHGRPEDSSDYADEGTAAHELAAWCLKDNDHPARYFGRVLKIVNGRYWPGAPDPMPAKLFGREKEPDIIREFEVDADMVAAINVYVQRVRQYRDADGIGGTMHVEIDLPIDHITGEAEATGKGDAIIITGDTEEIQAHDLKFGMGVRVYAEKNKQGMLYCLGAIKKYPGKYKRARIVIHQPRLSEKPDEWSCTIEELEAFAAEASRRAKDALTAYEYRTNWLGKSDTYLTVSEKGCMWCRAAASCPARDKHVQDTVGEAFEVLVPMAEGKLVGGVLNLIPTDVSLLGLKLRAVDLIEDWCKAIRAKVEAVLFEHDNDIETQTTLDFKLVEGKRGNRKFVDPDVAEAVLKKMRFKDDEIYNYKLKSPTQVCDVLLKDQPKRLEKILPLVTQAPGRPSVAPLKDKRDALVIKPTAEAFAVETTEAVVDLGGIG